MWNLLKNTSWVDFNEGSWFLSQQNGTCLISTSPLLSLANNMGKLKWVELLYIFSLLFFRGFVLYLLFILWKLVEHNQPLFFWRRPASFHLPAVYRVSLKQPRGSSLVANHSTADVWVTLDRTVKLVLVPVELSTSISGSHDTTYVVNAYLSQIRVCSC